MADTRDLGRILDAGIPLVAVESPDERRVLALLLRLAMERQLEFFEWSVTRGLRPGGIEAGAGDERRMTDPTKLLRHVAETPGPALYALCDLHPYLDREPTHVRYLKDAAMDFERLRNHVVLVSHALDMPPELSRFTATFEVRLPSDEELLALIREQAKAWSKANGERKVKTDDVTLQRLIANLRGVTHADARTLIRHAVFTDGAITESDLPAINRLKFELLDGEGVLRFEYETEDFSDVAGLDNLKRWLELRRGAFMEAGADCPRGIVLLGVQGSGKSLAAKAVAGSFGVPLLRLDFGTLYNKFFGETERNLRSSLRQAELMAPCVLWLDEIEKGIAVGESDNATSRRVLGTLLTWMAERNEPVFLVATSNDVTSVPPELIRKGRMDEVFFVDLPDAATRREVFRIHLRKRDLDPDTFDLEALSARAEGFTGAEIEAAIVSSRYLAASEHTAVTTAVLEAAVGRTYPISVLRGDAIDALRAWARDRTVPA